MRGTGWRGPVKKEKSKHGLNLSSTIKGSPNRFTSIHTDENQIHYKNFLFFLKKFFCNTYLYGSYVWAEDKNMGTAHTRKGVDLMSKKLELKEMELEQVAGGRPRIRLHGPRRKPFQFIRDIIDLIRDISQPKKENPQQTPQQQPHNAA